MNWFVRALALCSLFGLTTLAAAQDKATPAKEGAKAETEELKLANGRILLVKPAAWKKVQPKINMISYEFRAPAEAEQTARITITSATGGIEENLKRWIGQFDGAKKEDAKIDKKDVDKTTVHTLEIEGVYKDSSGGPFAPGPVKKLSDYAMLAAILELKDGTTEFIKMTGPKEVVAEQREAFLDMVKNLKNK